MKRSKPYGALHSLENALCFSSRDWSRYRVDAWIYGIIVGWSDESLEELAPIHGWCPDTVAKLKARRAEFEALKTGRDGASFDVEKR